MNLKALALAPILAVALLGCSAKTHITSTDPTLKVKINERTTLTLSQAAQRTYNTTSFGQYHFRAYTPEGNEMYGLMPLKFNHGYLVADILFFAPATFFNLREVFPYYEFDAASGEVRYKQKLGEAWSIYKPSVAEAERAKQYFSISR